MLEHDFKKFPELTNAQMQIYYFASPHKQILDDFKAQVVKCHDGDTISVAVDFRDFIFPVRLSEINAPELNEPEGLESRDWLSEKILKRPYTINPTTNKQHSPSITIPDLYFMSFILQHLH